MARSSVISEKTPLSVILFQAAMSRNQSVSKYADGIKVGAISLRQFILNKTERPRTKTLELISGALNMPIEEVRRRMEIAPESAPPFSEWLQGHMDGRSRASLAKETKISDGALKNYLTGQTLPDADQAQKIADALGLPPLEVAGVIVANQIVEDGGQTAEPSEEGLGSEAAPAAMAPSGTADAPTFPILSIAANRGHDEDRLIGLWQRLHPQGRRATLQYIAQLLAES